MKLFNTIPSGARIIDDGQRSKITATHTDTHRQREKTIVVLRYTTKKGQSRQYKSKSNGKEQGKKKKKKPKMEQHGP